MAQTQATSARHNLAGIVQAMAQSQALCDLRIAHAFFKQISVFGEARLDAEGQHRWRSIISHHSLWQP